MKLNMRMPSLMVTFTILWAFALPTFAAATKGDGYQKSKIADARFGTGERENLLKKAYSLRKNLNEVVFGQDDAIAVLQEQLIQYLEGYPNRTGEPVMMNMIGLPGIGKSAILEYLKRSGYPVAEFDAQHYASSLSNRSLEEGIYSKLLNHGAFDGGSDKPLIVFVEELDKLVEKNAVTGVETTSSAIGTMNMISSEGKIHYYGRSYDVSNVMFITTMNLSPVEIEAFSREVLGTEKTYYDYTIEDFAKFDEWVRTQPSARYKVLSRMFRSNTVGRFGANTTIMTPLDREAYRKIIELQVNRAIRQNVLAKNAEKRATVSVHDSMYDFLLKNAVYAPSGARETVSRSNALIEQLISFGLKATGPGVTAVDRPRFIEVRYHPELDKVFVRVTEMVLDKNSKTKLHAGSAVAFEAVYNSRMRLFERPDQVTSVKPAYPSALAQSGIKPVTKREVFATRFPKSQEKTNLLRSNLANYLFGQTEAINILATDFESYYGRQGPAKKEPSSRAFAGFPGIGKSELFIRSAEILSLPIARLNMQKYSSDSAETVSAFGQALIQAVEEAKQNSKDGRYILLVEELDKVFEIAPNGQFVNRPIMALIKDLLNDGTVSISKEYSTQLVDVRDAFVGITMNFAVDRFGFQADPRLTSIEDVMQAWRRMKMSPSAIKNVLGSMFLPDTVSRLMTQLAIIRPLDRPAYTKIIDTQSEKVVATRLLDENKRNVGQIELKTTPAYRRYLFSESVIPSEGARNTTKSSNAMISTDLEYALARLPRSSKYAKEPLTITFDYSEARQVVRFKVQLTNTPLEKPMQIEERAIALKFPPTNLRGRISEQRMHISAHEFGHAFTGVRLGARFEHIVVVPTPDAGGYVKPNGIGGSAADMIARIYMILGSRAFERIIFAEDPLSPESVLRITSGPSTDIKMATVTLFNMLYELGMNPLGGTLDRNFNMGNGQYGRYQDMPSELAEKMGLILRDLEDEIIRETLAEHKQDWYVEKIVTLARAGAMTEKEFYDLIGRKLPPADRQSVGSTNAYFRKMFESALVKETGAKKLAAKDRVGLSKLTAHQQSERAIETFARVVQTRLMGDRTPAQMPLKTCSDLFISAR